MTRRLDAAAVARDTIAVVRRHYAIFATLAAAFAFVPAAILGAAFPHAGQVPSLTHTVHPSPGYIAAVFVAGVITLIGMFTIADIAADPAEGGGRPLGATIAAVVPKIGKAAAAGLWLVAAYLIVALAVAVVLVIVVVLIALVTGGAGGAAAVGAKPDAALAGGVAAALVAIALPVVLWLYARLTPLLGVLLREPGTASAAIRQAWAMSRGSAGPIAALWLGLIAASLAFDAVVWAIVGAPATGAGLGAVQLAGIVVRSAFGAWLGMYFYAGAGVVYRHLAEA